MCDTSVALADATTDSTTLFAKNSDRHADECQPLCFYPRTAPEVDQPLHCTHRAIPQVPETFAILGSRPYWMWGFEIGVNEYGLTIGNEAVHGREGHQPDGLLGMDLIRLGLERARTADTALEVIVDLLERFGQGGNADILQPRSYHNSFIIADPGAAWVLETAGRYWAAERVRDHRAISNCYTITTHWDAGSPDLIDHAMAMGWCEPGQDFDFSRAYADPQRDVRSGQCRFRRATTLLGNPRRLNREGLAGILGDHGDPSAPTADEARMPICMHEGEGRTGATAASMVVQLRRDGPAPSRVVAWHSFGSPCLSPRIPYYVAAGPVHPRLGAGDGTDTDDSPWWRQERIQRRAFKRPEVATLVREYWARFDAETQIQAAEAENVAAGLTDVAAGRALAAFSNRRASALFASLEELDGLTESG